MTDSMGPEKLVRHMQNPPYTIHMMNTWYASDWDQAYRPSYAKICHTVVRHIQVHLYLHPSIKALLLPPPCNSVSHFWRGLICSQGMGHGSQWLEFRQSLCWVTVLQFPTIQCTYNWLSHDLATVWVKDLLQMEFIKFLQGMFSIWAEHTHSWHCFPQHLA